MRRLGRYPLAVMAWVAVYAGWSSLLGLVVAAVTGEQLDEGDRVAPTVGLGLSTLFTVLVPLVPTLVALWFNDWLRDGAPTRADRRAQDRVGAPATPTGDHPFPPAPPAPRPAVAPPPPAVVGVPAAAGPVRVVAAAPLGVPEVVESSVAEGQFPVAPVLRDDDTAPPVSLAALRPVPPRSADVPESPAFRALREVQDGLTAPIPPARGADLDATVAQRPAPPPPPPVVIDPDDPLGVGHLGLPRLDRG